MRYLALAIICIIMAFICSFFLVLANAEEIHFRWEPNTEPDLAGYRIYRGVNPGGPYGSNPVVEVPCPPMDSSCSKGFDTVNTPGIYFWVARAYDDEGFESENSNEQSKEILPSLLNVYDTLIMDFEQ